MPKNHNRQHLHSDSRLILALLTVFLFWFSLASNNFFHMDDWEWVALYEKGFWGMIMTPRDGEHFVPLAGIVFYVFFKLFGFSYIPFQLLNSLIHTVSSYLVYKIVKLEINNTKASVHSSRMALAAALLFGFASTAPDVLVWANSFLINTSGFFFFLGFYFFLLYTKSPKYLYIFISLISLLLSPRFQTITTIAPFAMAAVSYLRLKRKDVQIPVILFISTGILNIAATLSASSGNVQDKTLMITWDQLTQIPMYIFTGIYKGTFLRLVNPELYLLRNITHITQPIRIALAVLLPIVALFVFGQIRLNKKLLWKQNTRTYIAYFILLSVTYIMVAPFRVQNGIMQATIPRYTYIPVFFMIISFAVMYDSLFGKISKLISVLFIALLSLHIVADYNFNKNWHLNTEKDREFTQDTMYLLKNNSEVYDLQADGIWRIRLSDLDTLFAPGKNTSFYSPPLDTSAKFYIEADQKTKEIYQKLITVYDVYDPPFSVPYSM